MKKFLFLFFFLTLGLGWIATPDFPIQTTHAAPPAKEPIPRQVVIKVLNYASTESGIPYATLIDAYDNETCKISSVYIQQTIMGYQVYYGGLTILALESNI